MFFEDPLFWQSLKVSALYTLGSVPLQMLLGLGLALLLNQRVAGRGFWRTVFYLPSVVSGVAIAMIWSWFYHPDLGLFNNALLSIGIDGPRWLFSEVWALPSLILMNVWSVGPVMLIFLAGLQSIQKEFYEAAQIDGAGRRQQFWRITVPILSPQILFNTVLGIIGSFQVFTTAFVMTEGGPNNATRTLVLHMYSRGFLSARFGYSAALACILFVLLLVFIVFVLRSSRSAVFYEAQ